MTRDAKSAAVCCAAAALFGLLATALFFALHHAGNQIPYDLAQQRFKAEFAADHPDEGHAKGYKSRFEYCELSASVMAGATPPDKGVSGVSALEEAAILRILSAERHGRDLDLCAALEAASNGAEVGTAQGVKTRYWYGGKAIYAIALRYLSVRQIRELTLVSTRIAYLLLAASLVLVLPRALLVAIPLILFDAASGIEYWADVANGLPYLWTVLLATILVWLAHGRSSSVSVAVPVFLFAAGTVSSFLWFGDGHGLLAVTWIGLLAWFGGNSRSALQRTRIALLWISIYVLGFLVCYGLALAVKSVWDYDAYRLVLRAVRRTLLESGTGLEAGISAHLGALLRSFYIMAWPSHLPAGALLSAVSALALGTAVAFCVFVRRRRPELVQGVSAILALAAISAPQLLIADDILFRTARFMFVPHALCWSVFLLAVSNLNWKLSSALVGTFLAIALPLAWWFSDARLIGRLADRAGEASPVLRSEFEVYREGNKLVYVKDSCSEEDTARWFFLHVYPVDEADLPDWRRQYGFDNLDFRFERYGRGGYSLQGGGRCAAVRVLPNYGIARIATGAYVPGMPPVWRGSLESALGGTGDTRRSAHDGRKP